MRYYLKIFLVLFFTELASTAYGQTTSLMSGMKRINVSVDIPPYLEVSQNTHLINVTNEEKDSIPTMAQSYRLVRSKGSTAFKAFFGLVNSIIRYKEKDVVAFVIVLPGKGDSGRLNNMKTGTEKIYTLNEIPFSRIKADFNYGMKFSSVSDSELYDLDLMVSHCTREQAKKLFNADVMVTYPFNLEGNIYEKKYSVCRAVAVSKNGLSFFIYFMMTKDNYKNFDSYLADFKKVFWFNEDRVTK